MKVLITGCKGMLGQDLVKTFAPCHDVAGVDIEDFDITDTNAAMKYIASNKPNLVIHSAAYTDVDGCEQNRDLAFRVNALGARNIAAACDEAGAGMVYISTDYVFDGTKPSPYYEYDNTNPLSVYGRTKLEGENFVKSLCRRHYIVRTSWLFGMNGKNFVRTMLNLSREKKILTVVDDQVGSPTYTADLAKALLELVAKPAYGLYHITNEGYCSWYEFARYIFDTAGVGGTEVRPITTEELGRHAPRPRNSRLEKFYLRLNGYTPLRSYKAAAEEYIKSVGGLYQ